MSIVAGIRSSYSLFGAHGIVLVAGARLARRPVEVSVSVAGIRHPVRVRLRTTDVSVLSEMIEDVEYDLNLAVPPRVIVDAGANTGITSVFYANRYQHATIYAIEPEQSNFELLAKNAAPYENIVCLQAALWKDDGNVIVSDPGTGHWGFQTGECAVTNRSTVEKGITVDSLMARFNLVRIDLLRIDIEGAEREVFEDASRWINGIGVIAIELHDRIRLGCSQSVYAATKDFPWSFQRGETTFFGRADCSMHPDPPVRPHVARRRCSIVSTV